MKSVLMIALLSLSALVYSQPAPDPTHVVGNYFIPQSSGGSSGWIQVLPGDLANKIKSYNDGTTVDWEALRDDLEDDPQVGQTAVLYNSLSGYIPTNADYNLGGPEFCCKSFDVACEPFEWCYSWDCENCSCVDHCMDEDTP